MSTQERKLELERKKAKLAALRDSRNKRERVRTDLYVNGSPNSLSTSASAQDLRAEAEEMLRNLGLSETDVPSTGSGDSVPSRNGVSSNHVDMISSKRHHKLALCHVNELDVAPKSPIRYSKLTQTRDINPPLPHSVSLQHSDSPREIIGSPKFIAHLEWDDEFSMGKCQNIPRKRVMCNIFLFLKFMQNVVLGLIGRLMNPAFILKWFKILHKFRC
ncbi:Dynein intermediate chain cytosolic [Fasciola hepatica]|uniref:Dynein intermediate chain cytosolic n=1 Tax=Fasciola hepatica TaxID=6192 RepID=A0A4E0RVD6_FASHE|nr:Dynein intermediate chain cytosolic [Fasciola hepatica]